MCDWSATWMYVYTKIVAHWMINKNLCFLFIGLDDDDDDDDELL